MPESKSAQSFVPVKEVRNGIVILKDGSYRGILMCSSINFSLKSDDEQQAIISGFQSFLNTLDFSIEIVVHSRKMDIRPYLSLLNERMGAQTSELMRIQLREYIQFIQNFIAGSDIMTKLFYLVVPYTPSGASNIAASFKIPGLGGNEQGSTTSGLSQSFDRDRAQLAQRMALVASGISSSGLRAVELGTEEIIELLFRSFNPGETENSIRQST